MNPNELIFHLNDGRSVKIERGMSTWIVSERKPFYMEGAFVEFEDGDMFGGGKSQGTVLGLADGWKTYRIDTEAGDFVEEVHEGNIIASLYQVVFNVDDVDTLLEELEERFSLSLNPLLRYYLRAMGGESALVTTVTQAAKIDLAEVYRG